MRVNDGVMCADVVWLFISHRCSRSVCNDRLWRTANVGICYTFRCVHRGSKMSGCEGVAGNGLRPYKLRAMLSFCYFFRIKGRKCLIIT